MATELQVESIVRGHHVYKCIWTPVLEEELLTEQEDNNGYDNYAVCVKKGSIIIGHLPRSFSRISWFFLGHGGRIKCIITGRRKRGLGLEVPCTYIFIGSTKAVKKLKSYPAISQCMAAQQRCQ